MTFSYVKLAKGLKQSYLNAWNIALYNYYDGQDCIGRKVRWDNRQKEESARKEFGFE